MKRWGLAFLVVATGGCGTELRAHLKGVRTTIAEARENGAYKCAPRELAMAESHADFTDAELDYGDYFRAQEELKVADDNAKKALELSPKEKCNPSVAVVEQPKIAPPPKKKVEIVVLDTDHDGIPDPEDKCPTEPGPRENQGCPDTDRDKDGTVDRLDKCPDDPGPAENYGCPWPDRDRDTVPDPFDKCPDDPGPPENNGCPWPDRDKDGVADNVDQCPDTPGPPENHGCPKYNLIVVKADKIELKQKVHFATDKWKILPDSFAMLNEVADVLIKNPKIHVRIEGHTDSRGSRKHNMKLSDERAASVRNYLIGRGVDADHMESIGYGPDKPIDDNRTAIGRENNRRTEFFITAQ